MRFLVPGEQCGSEEIALDSPSSSPTPQVEPEHTEPQGTCDPITEDTNPPQAEDTSPSSKETTPRIPVATVSPRSVINQNNKNSLSPNSLEMLSRLFPNKKRSVLELVLRRCGDDLLKAIEEIVPRDGFQNPANSCANLQGTNALHHYLASYKEAADDHPKEDSARTSAINSSAAKSAFKPVSPSLSMGMGAVSSPGFGSSQEFLVGNPGLLSPPTAHQNSLPFAAMSSLLAQTNNSTASRLMSSMFYPPSELLLQAPHLPFAQSAALFTPSFYVPSAGESGEGQFFRNSVLGAAGGEMCCTVPGCEECSSDSASQGRKNFSKMQIN